MVHALTDDAKKGQFLAVGIYQKLKETNDFSLWYESSFYDTVLCWDGLIDELELSDEELMLLMLWRISRTEDVRNLFGSGFAYELAEVYDGWMRRDLGLEDE